MRSIIDRDIAHLEESIRALKSRRNELSPISRLPVEVLCNIFSLIEDNSIFYLGRSPESWSNFSQVSRHWRSSALSAPELWTKIPLSHPQWAQEMLTRSKKAKLTIRSGLFFDGLDPKKIGTVRSCLHEMNRVEEITLTSLPRLILEEIFRDVPKSAPQLHTLCIDSLHSGGTTFSIHEDFLCDTGRLRRVALIKCKIGWDSRFLTGLTRLTLDDSLEGKSSIMDLLHALQRMPALTDLILKDSIPDDSEGLSTYPVVDLPCLQLLCISCSISSVGALATVLRHITFPHIEILNLTCREEQSTLIDFSNFLVIATKLLSSFVIRGLILRASNNTPTHGLEFDLWTATNVQNCFPPSLTPTAALIRLGFKWPPSPQPHNHAKALTCAFGAISLPFLTYLLILDLDYINTQTWAKTLGKLPLLELVSVESDAPLSFVEALVYKRKRSKRTVSFPKLRCIHLIGTIFATGPRCLSVDMLLDCLMKRCERKAEIQVLNLDDCYYISSDDVRRLGETVVEVIWDGKEQEVDDSSDGTTTDSGSDSDSDDFDDSESSSSSFE